MYYNNVPSTMLYSPTSASFLLPPPTLHSHISAFSMFCGSCGALFRSNTSHQQSCSAQPGSGGWSRCDKPRPRHFRSADCCIHNHHTTSVKLTRGFRVRDEKVKGRQATDETSKGKDGMAPTLGRSQALSVNVYNIHSLVQFCTCI